MKHAVSNAVLIRQDAVRTPSTAIAPWTAAAGGNGSQSPGHLTVRQLEVLALLCEGLPNKTICRRLNIASGTVKVHISSILRELGVASRLQAVVAASSLGLPGNFLAGAAQTDASPGLAALQVARPH